MPTTNSHPAPDSKVPPPSEDREAILQDLEEYWALLYEPLPAAEVNERLIHAKIDALLDRLNRLSGSQTSPSRSSDLSTDRA
jgi:hypothetical protein